MAAAVDERKMQQTHIERRGYGRSFHVILIDHELAQDVGPSLAGLQQGHVSSHDAASRRDIIPGYSSSGNWGCYVYDIVQVLATK